MGRPKNVDGKSTSIRNCYLEMFQNFDDVCTVDDVSLMMRLSPKRVYRMVRSGELKSVMIQGSIRIAKLWVIEYLQEYGFQRQQSFDQQRRAAVLVYCQIPRSRRQIQEYLDLSDKNFFLQTVLRPLLKEGVIRMTNPDSPSDVRQRYVATVKLNDEMEFEL